MVLIPTTDVSVIIPCLNEIATIGSCVESAFALFETFHYRGEVLVIDNGSTDNSAHLASVKGATIYYASTRGYGSACMTGLQHAKGNFLILGDGDGTYDFLEGIHLLTQLQSGSDVVIGSRLSGHIVSQAMPWLHRYVGVPILTWLLNRTTSLALSDAHCGLRAITQNCFRQLACRCEGMEFASELILEAASRGFVVGEVPITYHRRAGQSKLEPLSDGWRHLQVIAHYWNRCPKRNNLLP